MTLEEALTLAPGDVVYRGTDGARWILTAGPVALLQHPGDDDIRRGWSLHPEVHPDA
jgi:hypothetical protein